MRMCVCVSSNIVKDKTIALLFTHKLLHSQLRVTFHLTGIYMSLFNKYRYPVQSYHEESAVLNIHIYIYLVFQYTSIATSHYYSDTATVQKAQSLSGMVQQSCL